MGTCSIVGTYISNDQDDLRWHGRYCHSDGTPTGVGKTIFNEYKRVFQYEEDGGYSHKGVANLVEFLMHEKVGWSRLSGTSFDIKPAWINLGEASRGCTTKEDWDAFWKGADARTPACYSARGDTPEADDDPELGTIFTSEDWKDTSYAQWAFIIDIGNMCMNMFRTRELVYTVDLNGKEPDWEYLKKLGNEEALEAA